MCVCTCVCITVLISYRHPLLLQALIRLPPHLSDDEFVLNFFELRPEDLVDPTSVEREEGMGR